MSRKQKEDIPPAANVSEDEENSDQDFEDEEGGFHVDDIYIPPPVKPYCSAESKGPRLLITKLTNINFKSYANTIEVGPFHHRFSAVIGPNGSGKSNVIDSMLFVFGYRSNKVRTSKVSMMIHNSSKYPNLQSCSVSVHFQQVKDQADGTCRIIPDTELIVGRTAKKDNSSFYTINGKARPFNEVVKLLEGHGIDLRHNRFLILQGEVENIALMEPKARKEKECGLLEYLEDIIGTTRYKKPLLLLNQRVEKLNDDRNNNNNKCRLAERGLKDLELPMLAAVEYLEKENQLVCEKNLQMQIYVHTKKIEVSKLVVQKETFDAELKEHDDKYAEFKKERVEKESIIQEEMQKYQGLEKKFAEFNGLKEKAEKNRTEVQENMTASNNRRKELLKQVEKEKKNLDDYQNQPEKKKHEITESEIQIKKMTAEKEKAEAVLAENLTKLEQHTKPIQEKKEPLEVELATIKATLDVLKADYSLADKEMDIIKKDETTEARKYETLKNSLDETESKLADKNGTLNELNSNLPEMEKTLQGHKTKMQQLIQEEQTVTQELNKIKRKIDESSSTMQQARSNNRVLNSLMEQKRKGNIPGILGRLGDLGGIDKQYDVAISTCCGRLDNIVVETADAAEACIQFLKQHNLGRGNFIALDKIQGHAPGSRQQISTPENVHRLFDLVRTEDERVRVAFFFALHNTLVADNLDQGSRIAYGARKWRVVTLAGEVIETSGTMCGGGKSQIRGKMGTSVTTKSAVNLNNSVSERDLDAWNQQRDTLQYKVSDLQHQQSLLEENIKILSKLLKSRDGEINKLTFEVKSLTEALCRTKDQTAKQQKKAADTKSDPVKVKELEKRVSESKAQYQQKQKEVDKIQAKVDELTKQILDITNEKVKSVRQKVDKLAKQIDKLATNISKLNVEIRNIERKALKTKENITNAEKEVEEAQNKIRALGVERTQLQEDVEKLQTKVDEIQKQIENASSGSSTTKKEITALLKLESEGKIKRLELDERVKTMDKKLGEEKAQIPHWEKRRNALKLQTISSKPPPEPLKIYTDAELAEKDMFDSQYKITKLEEELSKDKPNLGAIDDYNKKQIDYLEKVNILEAVTKDRNVMREHYDKTKKRRLKEFSDGFAIISRKLKEMYQMITLGGDAELEHVDSMDPFNEGTRFAVRPPKKSWKLISNLSGGEKTLSSLALVFALHYYKPSPLYFMDEIDAALDFKNVSIVANYINERTKNAQFIIISLRANMFELADYLVGIYKTNDCTHSLTIKNSDKVLNPTTCIKNTNNIMTSNEPEPMDTTSPNDVFDQVKRDEVEVEKQVGDDKEN